MNNELNEYLLVGGKFHGEVRRYPRDFIIETYLNRSGRVNVTDNPCVVIGVGTSVGKTRYIETYYISSFRPFGGHHTDQFFILVDPESMSREEIVDYVNERYYSEKSKRSY